MQQLTGKPSISFMAILSDSDIKTHHAATNWKGQTAYGRLGKAAMFLGRLQLLHTFGLRAR